MHNPPVMILAAGLGTRMAPLNLIHPKPLIPVCGRPLLDYVFDRVAEFGPSQIIMNIHAHPGQMIKYAQSQKYNVVISDERRNLLDSGGGIAAAFAHHHHDYMLCVNADIFWLKCAGSSLLRLWGLHQRNKRGISMLLGAAHLGTGYDGRGDFDLDAYGCVIRKKKSVSPYVFLGAQVVHRSFFEGRAGQRFSVRDIWSPLLERGDIKGLCHDGPWYHVGTPQAVEDAERALVRYA